MRRSLIRLDQAIKSAAPPGNPVRSRAVLEGFEVVYEEETPHKIQRAIESEEDGETRLFRLPIASATWSR